MRAAGDVLAVAVFASERSEDAIDAALARASRLEYETSEIVETTTVGSLLDYFQPWKADKADQRRELCRHARKLARRLDDLAGHVVKYGARSGTHLKTVHPVTAAFWQSHGWDAKPSVAFDDFARAASFESNKRFDDDRREAMRLIFANKRNAVDLTHLDRVVRAMRPRRYRDEGQEEEEEESEEAPTRRVRFEAKLPRRRFTMRDTFKELLSQFRKDHGCWAFLQLDSAEVVPKLGRNMEIAAAFNLQDADSDSIVASSQGVVHLVGGWNVAPAGAAAHARAHAGASEEEEEEEEEEDDGDVVLCFSYFDISESVVEQHRFVRTSEGYRSMRPNEVSVFAWALGAADNDSDLTASGIRQLLRKLFPFVRIGLPQSMTAAVSWACGYTGKPGDLSYRDRVIHCLRFFSPRFRLTDEMMRAHDARPRFGEYGLAYRLSQQKQRERAARRAAKLSKSSGRRGSLTPMSDGRRSSLDGRRNSLIDNRRNSQSLTDLSSSPPTSASGSPVRRLSIDTRTGSSTGSRQRAGSPLGTSVGRLMPRERRGSLPTALSPDAQSKLSRHASSGSLGRVSSERSLRRTSMK